MGLCGLDHGEVALAAKPLDTGCEERHGLIERFGCSVLCRDRKGYAQFGRMPRQASAPRLLAAEA
jgi:hypothetical protein